MLHLKINNYRYIFFMCYYFLFYLDKIDNAKIFIISSDKCEMFS